MSKDPDQRFSMLPEGMIPALPDFGQIHDVAHQPMEFQQGDVDIEYNESGGGVGGADDGFREIDVVLCRNGGPVSGKILFKED